MRRLPYNQDLKLFSRYLRNHSTPGEILLWKQLRAGNLMNYTFNRQKPLGNFIVDFYCAPLHLVIEVDGAYHFEPEQRLKDAERQSVLEGMGLHFLRFEEMQVKKDRDQVIAAIQRYIQRHEALRPGSRPTRQRSSRQQ